MTKLQKLVDRVEAGGFGLVPKFDDDGGIVFEVRTAPDRPLGPKHLRTIAEVEAFLIGAEWARAKDAQERQAEADPA